MTALAPVPRRRAARRWCVLSALAVTATITPALIHGPPLILWNASASVPIGLYAVAPGAPLRAGDLAVSHLPASVSKLAADRRYLPSGVLLIKPVAATAGAKVCRIGTTVFVNDRSFAVAQSQDTRGRKLLAWRGCQVISPQQIFLANPAVPESFDGRYFGPVSKNLTVGRAFPLLTKPGALAE